jgi:NAD(P)-dependent dehydrogenase (short-subunit alcohol dehydrogenase family)
LLISSKEVYAQFNTNVFGAANITRASVPYLRKAAQTGSSHVVIAHFGSVASYWSYPAMAHYCASKAAVSLLTDGIGREVAPFGIKACTIEPGFFRTEFLNMGEAQRRVQTAVTLSVYAGTPVADSRELLIKANNNQAGDPEKGAKVIVDVFTGTGVAIGKEIPDRLHLGSDIVGTLKDSIIPGMLKTIDQWGEISESTGF